MRVAVLASGPGLVGTWHPGEAFDAVIAVNVAATLFPCDWWVAGDGPSFDRFQPIAPPRVGVVTDALTYKRTPWWREAGDRLRVQRWCDFRAPFGSGQWHTSGPTAVGFAALILGATEVHCYGMDMAGAFDLDGSPACLPTGVAHRWSTEAAELVAIAAAGQTEIIRHLADESIARSVPPPPRPPADVMQCGYCGGQSMREVSPGRWRCGRCGTRR